MQLVHVYLNWFLHNSLLKCVSQPELAKKSIKPLFWCSRSSKVIEFGGNRQPVYYLLLVINSNLARPYLAPVLRYWLKIANFSHLSFSALLRGNPLRIYEKSFTVPETRVFQAADGKNLVILASTVFDWSTRVSDGETGRRTELRWLRCADSSSCFRA